MNKKKPVCIYLKTENSSALKILAAEKMCFMSDIINLLIEKYIVEKK